MRNTTLWSSNFMAARPAGTTETMHTRVALLRDSNRRNLKENIKKLVGLIGGIQAVVRPSQSVLIKPNVLCGLKAETGATVCPEIVEAIVELSKDAGASRVVIGEASNWGIDTLEAFRACGYDALAARCGAELVDLKRDRQVQVSIDNALHHTIELPQTVLEADVVVDIPVLKTHNQTIVSVSLKNLSVGTCSDRMKKTRMHSIGLTPPPGGQGGIRASSLDHMIASVSKVLPCHLVVVDGFFGMHGYGSPIRGEPANAGILVCGTDRVAVDATSARLIGVTPEQVPHIVLSAQAGIGTLNREDIELVGDSLEAASVPFQGSIIVDIDTLAPANVKVVCKDACYACVSNLGYFLREHRAELERLGPVTFVVGRVSGVHTTSPNERIVYYGNCAGADMYGGGFVPGCVPRSRRQIFEALGIGDRYESYEW
jgi:uncharacterized protein (DUF362 family)